MQLDEAIRSRRTVKEGFRPEPVPREVLEELFELARWAPNHRMTEPWRFRVLGEESLAALKEAAGPGAFKLDRAPTLIVASYLPSPLPLHADEDAQAVACATYIILLGARARGYASYWRTPGVLRTPYGLAAVGVPHEERVIGLLHLGLADEVPEAPPRAEAASFATFLP